MSTLVNCPKCRMDIESDSYYCDQCGVELYICPQCKIFGKGKRCTQCGQALVVAEQLEGGGGTLPPPKPSPPPSSPPSPIPLKPSLPPSPTDNDPDKTERPNPPSPGHLTCAAIGARLGLGDGAVIGRRNGDYTSVFASQGYVSGTHARLQKNTAMKWEILDLDSTNGTFLNGTKLAANVPVEFKIGDIIRIANLDFNVEP